MIIFKQIKCKLQNTPTINYKIMRKSYYKNESDFIYSTFYLTNFTYFRIL